MTSAFRQALAASGKVLVVCPYCGEQRPDMVELTPAGGSGYCATCGRIFTPPSKETHA